MPQEKKSPHVQQLSYIVISELEIVSYVNQKLRI